MRRNVPTNTAVETASHKFGLFELNDKYSACPVRVSEYEINGSKYKVHSHFVGEKDIDDVINNIATAKRRYLLVMPLHHNYSQYRIFLQKLRDI